MSKSPIPAAGEAMPKADTIDLVQLIQAEDTLGEAAQLVGCVIMACTDLESEGAPVQTVAILARRQIREALGMLEEIRRKVREGQSHG